MFWFLREICFSERTREPIPQNTEHTALYFSFKISFTTSLKFLNGKKKSSTFVKKFIVKK